MSVAATLVLGPVLSGLAVASDPITVEPGDTLTAISKRHGVTIEEITRLNELPDPNRIFAGQRLRLEADEAAPAAAAPKATQAPVRSHTVGRGEHLTGIARHYGVSVADIVASNGIANPSRIYAGQRLAIPGERPASEAPAAKPRASTPPAETAAKSHTVRRGEHLTGIARHFGVTVAEIVAANGIIDASRIYIGQRLLIPGTMAPAPVATPTPAIPEPMRAVMARRDDVRRLIVEEAERFDVPATLALAVAWQESGWQQGVISHAGAIGVMQLLPATGEWVGEVMLGERVDLRSTRDNVRAGVRLLDHYLARYDGNVDLVLAAYYQGQTAADRHGVYPVSRGYIASIRALARMLGG